MGHDLPGVFSAVRSQESPDGVPATQVDPLLAAVGHCIPSVQQVVGSVAGFTEPEQVVDSVGKGGGS